jgi:hypothetical protein
VENLAEGVARGIRAALGLDGQDARSAPGEEKKAKVPSAPVVDGEKEKGKWAGWLFIYCAGGSISLY